jgi:hypothetical protein
MEHAVSPWKFNSQTLRFHIRVCSIKGEILTDSSKNTMRHRAKKQQIEQCAKTLELHGESAF